MTISTLSFTALWLAQLAICLPIEASSRPVSLPSSLGPSTWQDDHPITKRMVPPGNEIQPAFSFSATDPDPAQPSNAHQSNNNPGIVIHQPKHFKRIARPGRVLVVGPHAHPSGTNGESSGSSSSRTSSHRGDIESGHPIHHDPKPVSDLEQMRHHLQQSKISIVGQKSFEDASKHLLQPMHEYVVKPLVHHAKAASGLVQSVYTGNEHDGVMNRPTNRPKAVVHAAKHAAATTAYTGALALGAVANGPALLPIHMMHTVAASGHGLLAGAHAAAHLSKHPQQIKDCISGVCKAVADVFKSSVPDQRVARSSSSVRRGARPSSSVRRVPI